MQATAAATSKRDVSSNPYVSAARAAGLSYVGDDMRGWRRQRRGKAFSYLTHTGTAITDATALARIRKLAIPPAWEQVWICPRADGHIQATGRDVRGRKQYRYHPAFVSERDRHKYDRVLDLARALPKIRAAAAAAIARPGLQQDKVVAAIILLLEQTLIRVGNEEYARANHSYGLTTLRNRHVTVRGATMHFHFRGKSGVDRQVLVRNARLAQIVTQCRAMPGALLFQYRDADGRRRAVSSADVNAFLRQVTGRDFTAKDIRTFHGTLLATTALRDLGRAVSASAAKRAILTAVRATALRLGNTPAVCRRAYIHPAILHAYNAGSILPSLSLVASPPAAQRLALERAVISFVRRCVAANRHV